MLKAKKATIFISSRMNGEADSERIDASRAIQDFSREHHLYLDPVTFEHQAAPPSTTAVEASLSWVAQSDAFIGIYYKTISPILRQEFRVANDRNMPIFLFVREVEIERLSNIERLQYEELRNFLRREAKPISGSPSDASYVYKRFAPGRLSLEIKRALSAYYPHFDLQRKRIPEQYVLPDLLSERLHALPRTFVRPLTYDSALRTLLEKRLLFILGPPGIGKTTLSLMLAREFRRQRRVRRVLRFPRTGKVEEITGLGLADSIIVFDDVFGATEFDSISVALADSFEEIQGLARTNYVILSSRENVIPEVRERTRFGEIGDLSECMVKLSSEDFDETRLQKVLLRRIRVAGLSRDAKARVRADSKRLVGRLLYPGNIDFFVLSMETEPDRELERQIEEAKRVEITVGRWFERWYKKDPEVFYFLFSLAFFAGMEEANFMNVWRTVVSEVRRLREVELASPRTGDLRRVPIKAGGYVEVGGSVQFRHPTYREGVVISIANLFRGDVEAIFESSIGHPLEYEIGAMTLAIEILPQEGIDYMKRLIERGDLLEFSEEVLMRAARGPTEKVLCLLEKLCEVGNWVVMAFSEGVLLKLGARVPESVIPMLLRWTESGSSVGRSRGVRSLGGAIGVRFEQLFPRLQEWAADDDWMVRKAVALALRRVRAEDRERARAVLNALSRDGHWLVRNEAEWSLRRYDSSAT